MPQASVLLAAASNASHLASPDQGGPGWILRGVIVVGVVGGGLLAWLLLRGYGKQD